MLVLSRKKNESIVIDDRIVITVVEIRGDKVRLGIEAPRDVPVHRSEVYEAIHRAAEGSPKAAGSEVPATDK
jgi:carbon storage regulator